MTSQDFVTALVFLAPALAGGVIALANADSANAATERGEAWARAYQQRTAVRPGWFFVYVLNPLLWAIVRFCDWTDGFAHRGLKNGARVAVTLYRVGLWLVLIYAAVVTVIAVAILLIAIYIAGKMLSGDRGSTVLAQPARRFAGGGFGLFATECASCGSTEHASAECPHGLFSSACAHCGSRNHASDTCPHGMFSSKCTRCGSVEHASDACPHGWFQSACAHCGSRSHASDQCPHGVFSSACAYCGSRDHATERCPH